MYSRPPHFCITPSCSSSAESVDARTHAVQLGHRVPYQAVAFKKEEIVVDNDRNDRAHHVGIAQDSAKQKTFRLLVRRNRAVFIHGLFVHKFRHIYPKEI